MEVQLNPSQTIKLYDVALATNMQMVRKSRDRNHRSAIETQNNIVLLRELEMTGVLVSVMAGVANALAQDNAPPVNPRSLATYYPQESAICLAASRYLARCGHSDKVLARLERYLSTLSLARRLSVTYITLIHDPLVCERERAADLSTAWRNVCHAMLMILNTLKQSLGDAGIPPAVTQCAAAQDQQDGAQDEAPQEEDVYGLLQRAKSGEFTCVNSDGTAFVPTWADRRSSNRVQVNVSVAVIWNAERYEATLRDISVSGMGISGLSIGEKGDVVSVALPHGQKLHGTIIWSGQNRMGLELSTPFDPNALVGRSILVQAGER